MPKMNWSLVNKRLSDADNSRAEWLSLSPAERQQAKDDFFLIRLDELSNNSQVEAIFPLEGQRERINGMLPQIYKIDTFPKGRWVEFYSVPSDSDERKVYVVAKDRAGRFGCSCPRWIYKREDCKHVQRVVSLINRETVSLITTDDLRAAGVSDYARKALDRFSNLVLDEPANIQPDSQAGNRAKFFEPGGGI